MANPSTKNLHNRKVGAWGENLAADYLIAHGYELVARNARTEAGEIDLIARKDGLLSFVEVKTRRSDRFGAPEEAITPVKQQRMEDSAELWLTAHPGRDGRLAAGCDRHPHAAGQPATGDPSSGGGPWLSCLPP